MKRIMTFGAVVTILTFALAGEASAQQGRMRQGGGGWGPGTPYGRMYNPQTVESITGTVVSVGRITPIKGMASGLHIVVKTDKETIAVHLGPSWYLDHQDIQVAPKDTIEVRGSRITFEGNPALIAAEVKKGDEVLTLRDANGVPVWSGWRHR